MLSTINPHYLGIYESMVIKNQTSVPDFAGQMLESSMSAGQMVGLINELAGISLANRQSYPSKNRKHWFQECTITHPGTGEEVTAPGYYYMDSAFVRDMLDNKVFSECEVLRHDKTTFNQSGVGVATTLEEVMKYVNSYHMRYSLLKKINYVVRVEKSADIELFLRTPHRGVWGEEHGSKNRRNQIELGNHRGISDIVGYWRPESKFSNEKIKTRYGGLSNAMKISPRYIGKSFYYEAQLFIKRHESFLFFEILAVHGGARGELSVLDKFPSW